MKIFTMHIYNFFSQNFAFLRRYNGIKYVKGKISKHKHYGMVFKYNKHMYNTRKIHVSNKYMFEKSNYVAFEKV